MRKEEGDLVDTQRRQCEDGGKDESDEATSQVMPAAIRSWKRRRTDSPVESLEGAQPC